MKSFSKYISEVAQPRERGAEEEQAFKDQHTYEVIPHPVALDTQFTGDIQKPQAMRPADNKGDMSYDKAYAVNNTGFEDFDESVNEGIVDGIKKAVTKDSSGASPLRKKLNPVIGKSSSEKAADAAKRSEKIRQASLAQIQRALSTMSAKKKKANEAIDEAAVHSDKHINMAIGIASDKRYKGGNMTGAVKAMNKMKPGISDHPKVAAVLKRQNEDQAKEEELSPKQKKIDHNKNGKIDGHDLAMIRQKKNEEVEQLDELSPETLKSYKKKATKQYKQSANKRMPGGGDYGSATKAAQDKHQKRFDKRHKGIGSEIKRTTDSDIHLKDPKGLVRKDPKSNSMTGKPAPYKNKAESYVTEDMNKVHTVDIDHTGGADAAAKKHNITLKKSKHTPDSHSASGKKKDLQKYLAHHYDSSDDAKEIHPEVHETTQLDELSPKTMKSYDKKADASIAKAVDTMKGRASRGWAVDNDSSYDTIKKRMQGKASLTRKKVMKRDGFSNAAPQYSKKANESSGQFDETTQSAIKKPVTMTGPDGKTRTVMRTIKPKNTDDAGQDKIITNESIIKELEENVKFKVGLMKLKDGKSVVLKKQDADLLTQMFKDLSANNRRKLGMVATKDESGFKEILGFAREAL